MQKDIQKILAQMTLEEKAELCSGFDFWHTKSCERLGIPPVVMSDGPHGLRRQTGPADHLGIHRSTAAVCFPSAAGTACSFNRGLLRELGRSLGEEAQAENVQILLGPAVNIKRSPLCGRNFEYFSEDPYLSGELAAGYIEGVQSQGVGTSIKHFAANSQETSRLAVSANMSERTLREIYLPAFETAVKKAQPWTLMSSYNRINGRYVEETPELLTGILRGEWGFEGAVMSDWFAVDDRVASLKAGQDLEMPGGITHNTRRILGAVKSGELEESVLDRAAERLLRVIFRVTEQRRQDAAFSVEEHHRRAYRIALESMVLLKNESGILPLKQGGKVVFIGEFAKNPRFQGGGSSHVFPAKVTSAWEAAAGVADLTFAQGYRSGVGGDGERLLREAAEAARNADTAVVFAGLPDAYESEGRDRAGLDLPEAQNRLISAVAAALPNTVVVLHNGSPVTMPGLPQGTAVLESYLGGEAVGLAQADLLFGRENPSGRLAETFPLCVQHTPCYLNFPGFDHSADYAEGVFVGYRYYSTKNLPVLFPFGFGLSYTTFEYSGLALSSSSLSGGQELRVTCRVRNTGSRAGRETVQLYICSHTGGVPRPSVELKGFDKVELQPGEEKEVAFFLPPRAFAYYDEQIRGWYVESGRYTVMIGHSSAEPVLQQDVFWRTPPRRGFRVTENTLLKDLVAHPVTRPVLEGAVESVKTLLAGAPIAEAPADEGGEDFDPGVRRDMMLETPLRNMREEEKPVDEEAIGRLIAELNEALERSER